MASAFRRSSKLSLPTSFFVLTTTISKDTKKIALCQEDEKTTTDFSPKQQIAENYASIVQGPFPKSQPSPIRWNNNWDLRHDLYKPPANESDNDTTQNTNNNKHKAIHQIILVRHGQYHHEPTESHQHTLTDLGRYQATLTGQRLQELIQAGIIHKIHHIYYSTMIRATQTWEMIQPSLANAQLLPSLQQIEPCSMIREAAVCQPIPPSTLWKPKGEELFKDQQRVEAAFLKYLHRSVSTENTADENYSTLLVCHGNVIRYLVMRALQLPPEAWLRTAVWNASITILEIYPSGRVSLRCFGDVGHIPADKITYM